MNICRQIFSDPDVSGLLNDIVSKGRYWEIGLQRLKNAWICEPFIKIISPVLAPAEPH